MVYIAIPLSALFFCIFLAIYILWSDKKSTTNKFFVLQIFSASFWIFSNFMADIAKTAEANLFWSRITLIGASLVAVFFYFFSLHFPKEKPSNPVYKYVVSFLGLLIIILSPTKWNIVSVYSSDGGFGINTGFLYLLFLFYFALTTIFSVFNFWHRADTDIEKTQVKFVITGIMLSIVSSFLTNAILPVLGNSQYVSVGSYFIVFFLIFTFYAIIKHHLFNIKVIATELFTLALWVILLIRIFLSDNPQDLTINLGIFVAVVAFGILLVRSVIKEVKQREQMEKMAKEVEKAYEVEKRANVELQELDKVKDQFLMITQHDLRRPLTLVKWFLDTMFLGLLGKQNKQTLDEAKKVQTAIENSIEEVNAFLDITQFQMGKGGLALKPGVELLAMLEGIVKKLEPQAEQKGIYLKLEKPKELFPIEADEIKLKAALSNIVDNAIKYTQEGGVEITISPNDRIPIPKEILNPNEQNSKSVFITVKDTGIGIPQDKIDSLFTNMFERTEQAQRATAIGKGIGLYLSSQIIKAHKGKIWAESAGEGKGSTFFIELPAE